MSEKTALILIDVQEGFYDPFWGKRNNPLMEENVSALLEAWRTNGCPIYHIQHLSTQPASPLHPTKPGVEFASFALPKPGEPIFQKQVNSAFIGTTLKENLTESGYLKVLLAGFTSDHCISTTARMAANLGFEVSIAEDATANFDRVGPDGTHYKAELVHAVTFASLHGEFADVVTTQQIMRRF